MSTPITNRKNANPVIALLSIAASPLRCQLREAQASATKVASEISRDPERLRPNLTFLKVEPVMVVSKPSTFNVQLTRLAAACEIKRKGGNHHGQNAGSGF